MLRGSEYDVNTVLLLTTYSRSILTRCSCLVFRRPSTSTFVGVPPFGGMKCLYSKYNPDSHCSIIIRLTVGCVESFWLL